VQPIDWREAHRFLRKEIRRSRARCRPDELDDLNQEALVRLFRASRREEIRNLEAFMTTIAQRTAVDGLRRRKRWNAIMAPLRDGQDLPSVAASPAPVPAGDPVSRLAFIVLELLERQSSGCLELARANMQGRNWAQVADDLGVSHDAVRARWSRCRALLRGAIMADPKLRDEFGDGLGGES